MSNFFEHLISSAWNHLQSGRRRTKKTAPGVVLGHAVVDEQVTSRRVGLSLSQRGRHQAILGRTGSGKSRLILLECLQDIRADRGFLFFDLHGDATPFLLSAIAEEEWNRREQLSDRVVVIEPGEASTSVGLNPLGAGEADFVAVAEIAELLKSYWGLFESVWLRPTGGQPELLFDHQP